MPQLALPEVHPLLQRDLELVPPEEALRAVRLLAVLAALVLELLTVVVPAVMVAVVILLTVLAPAALVVTRVTVEPETTVLVQAGELGLVAVEAAVAIMV